MYFFFGSYCLIAHSGGHHLFKLLFCTISDLDWPDDTNLTDAMLDHMYRSYLDMAWLALYFIAWLGYRKGSSLNILQSRPCLVATFFFAKWIL
jgi:hypothetical protein